MKIYVFTRLEKQLFQEWHMLWQNSPYANIYNSPHWFISALEVFDYKQIRIIASYDRSNLIGIVGLCQTTFHGLPVWTSTAIEYTNKNPFLYQYIKQNLLHAFFQTTATLGNVLLPHCQQDFTKRLQRNLHARVLYTQKSPWIDSTKNILGSFPTKKIALVTNRLKKVGGEIVLRKYANSQEAFEMVFRIDKDSSKAAKGKSVFTNKKAQKFYMSLASSAPQHVLTHILFFGKIPVAYSIGFLHKNTFEGSQKGHLQEYNYFKPGQALVLKILQDLQHYEIKEVDLGLGIDAFKLDFTKNYRELESIFFSKNSMLATYMIAAHTIRENIYANVVNTKAYVWYKQLVS